MHSLHVAQMEMEAFLSFQAHTKPHQPTTLSDARSLARQHTLIHGEMVIVCGSFSIFSPCRMGVSGDDVCVCMHFLWTHFALASPPCNFNGIRSICSWSFLQLVLFSFVRFVFCRSYYRFFVICFGCDPVEGHLRYDFTIWIIYVVEVKKCQHES